MATKQSATIEIDFSKLTFACSDRTEAVDYTKIAKNAISILGSKEIVVALGWKLNTRGLKMKDGQFIKVGEIEMTSEQILSKLTAQEGFKKYADPSASRIGIGKEVVTISRIARATAGVVASGIKAGKLSLGPDCEKLRELAGITSEEELPRHYSFLNAAYAMNDAEVAKFVKGFTKFLAAFQTEIDKAVSAGWVKTNNTKKRDYVKEYMEYIGFRGIVVATA